VCLVAGLSSLTWHKSGSLVWGRMGLHTCGTLASQCPQVEPAITTHTLRKRASMLALALSVSGDGWFNHMLQRRVRSRVSQGVAVASVSYVFRPLDMPTGRGRLRLNPVPSIVSSAQYLTSDSPVSVDTSWKSLAAEALRWKSGGEGSVPGASDVSPGPSWRAESSEASRGAWCGRGGEETQRPGEEEVGGQASRLPDSLTGSGGLGSG